MAMLAMDARYDAILIDYGDGTTPDATALGSYGVGTGRDVLPLMLTKEGNTGYSRSFPAPFAGSLGEGDQQDSTLGAWVTLTQRDWSGGGQEDNTAVVGTRFNSGTADTRYAGRFTMRPKLFGPYALPSPSGSNVALGAPVMRYQHNLYYAAGGKLYRSILDTAAISGGALVPNWASISTDAIWASVTDFDLIEETTLYGTYSQAAYIVGVTGAAGKFFNVDGTLRNITSQTPKYISFLGLNKIGAVQFPSASAPETAGLFIRADLHTMGGTQGPVQPNISGVIANNVFILNGTGYAIASNGIYALSNSSVSSPMALVKALGIYESATAGLVGTMWKGAFYFGVAGATSGNDALLKFDGGTLVNVGPNRNPNARVADTICTTPRQLVATDEALYMLCSDSGTKRDSIWVMTGDGVWHMLWLADNADPNNYGVSIGIDTRMGNSGGTPVLALQPRLWLVMKAGATINTYYMYVGENLSGAYVFSVPASTTVSRKFAGPSEVVSSWWGSKYSQLRKVIGGVIVAHKEWSGTHVLSSDVQCALEVDRGGVFKALDLARYDGVQHEFITEAATWVSKTVTTTGTLVLVLNDLTGLSSGDFVWVGDEVTQIKRVYSFGSPLPVNGVELVRALRKAPATGTVIFPAPPMGIEFRVRITIHSTIDDSYTPEVLRVGVQMAYQAVDKPRHTLYVKVEDGQSVNGQAGAAYDYDADTLRAALEAWAKKPMFWLVTPLGKVHRVRCVNASESRVMNHTAADWARPPKSVVALTLIDV